MSALNATMTPNVSAGLPHQAPLSWTLAELRHATGGNLVCGEPGQIFAGVSIDSRTIAADQVFVAIRGQTHDGHGFVADVLAKGIQGLVLAAGHKQHLDIKELKRHGVCCLMVADTTVALGDLAAFNRQRAGVKVAAITGSNGKTSTRRMVAAVLAQKFNLLRPKGNFNNEIGLPLTLLRLAAGHQWAVLELGMNHFGEIDRLGAICAPDIGLITNIGPAHLEGVGSLEGVMRAKGELLGRIPPGGTAVLNADDPRVAKLARQTEAKCLLFGLAEGAEISARNIGETDTGLEFRLVLPGGRPRVRLSVPGRFMVLNALAAAAVGHLAGLSPEEIKTGLEAFMPAAGRMKVLSTAAGVTVIDDTYNANPGSMQAAAKTLRQLSRESRAIMVVGDMLELGPQASQWHRDTGAFIARSGINKLYATGRHAQDVAEGAIKAGLPPEKVATGSKDEITAMLLKALKPGDRVLVKGSRGMQMETIVAALTAACKNHNLKFDIRRAVFGNHQA